MSEHTSVVCSRVRELIKGWLALPPATEPDIERIAKVMLQIRYPHIEVVPGKRHPNSAAMYSQQYIADLTQERGYPLRRTTISNIEKKFTDTIQDRTFFALVTLLSGTEIEVGSDEWDKAINQLVYWSGVKRPLETMARKSHLQRVEALEKEVEDLTITTKEQGEEIEYLVAQVEELRYELELMREGKEMRPERRLYLELKKRLINAGVNPDTDKGQEEIRDRCKSLKRKGKDDAISMLLGEKTIMKGHWPVLASVLSLVTEETWTHKVIKDLATPYYRQYQQQTGIGRNNQKSVYPRQ